MTAAIYSPSETTNTARIESENWAQEILQTSFLEKATSYFYIIAISRESASVHAPLEATFVHIAKVAYKSMNS